LVSTELSKKLLPFVKIFLHSLAVGAVREPPLQLIFDPANIGMGLDI
jgi:hypothetical protein